MKILILSGVHGSEQSAVICAKELQNYFSDNDNITIIPQINKSGLLNNKRETDVISDLNRSLFDNNYIETINELKYQISKHDIVIDIHNSPNCDNFVLLDSDCNTRIIDACRKLNIEYGVNPKGNQSIKTYANSQGKIALTYEFSPMISDGKHSLLKINKAIIDIAHLCEFDWKNSEPTKLDHILESSDYEGFTVYKSFPGDVVNGTACLVDDVPQNFENFKILAVGTNVNGGVIGYHKN